MMSSDGDWRARGVALSFLANPGDVVLGSALRTRTANELLALVTGGATGSARSRARPDWPRGRRGGCSWSCPAMPSGLPSSMTSATAAALWRQGSADMRLTCVNSVAIVGSRAATGYGQHVAVELAATLAECGTTVISGGAYGTKTQMRSRGGVRTQMIRSCRRRH